MGYSDNEAMVRVDFFKPSGKWYTTEAILWTGQYSGQLIHDAFAQSLRDSLNKDGQQRLKDMDAVCLAPHHEDSHPICLRSGKWNNQ